MHSRMPAGLLSLSIKLLVRGLREEMEVKAERGVGLIEKFQKKFRVDILVFCLLV